MTDSFIRKKNQTKTKQLIFLFLYVFLRIVALLAKVPCEIFSAFTVSAALTPSHENSNSSTVCFHGRFYSELPDLQEI